MKIARSDTLPENQHFPDTGCEKAPSCLECPLAICKHDDPAWLPAHDRAERDRKIFDLRKKGMMPSEISRVTGVAQRSVYRVIQQGGPSERDLRHIDSPETLSLDKLARKSPIKARKPWPQLMRRVS